jgi:hypothetical protein
MGKGSNRRREDIAKIWDNWDTIFGKKDIKEELLDEKELQEESTDEALKDNAK